jgi:hypothetical protein
VDPSPIEVHVFPLDPEKLAATHTRVEQKHESWVEAGFVLPGRAQERSDLIAAPAIRCPDLGRKPAVHTTHQLADPRRRSAFNADHDWVFANRHGTPLDIHRVSRNVRKIFGRAGLYQRGQGTVHLIRHSVASRLCQEKMEFETLGEILGHSLVSTNALYIHTTNEAKRDAARRLELL